MYGSPEYLTKEYINPLKGIVNGTPCTLHSLSWKDANVHLQMQEILSMAPDNEIVMLCQCSDTQTNYLGCKR